MQRERGLEALLLLPAVDELELLFSEFGFLAEAGNADGSGGVVVVVIVIVVIGAKA